MTFFVPQIFTGIAFDSGGVASGPMTATFLLLLAMVVMTPLLTIQMLVFNQEENFGLWRNRESHNLWPGSKVFREAAYVCIGDSQYEAWPEVKSRSYDLLCGG